jgi:uncharacterized protein YozE (UPF0346 family)
MLWVEVFVLKIIGYNKRNMEQNTTPSRNMEQNTTPSVIKVFNNSTFPKHLMNYDLLKQQVNEILLFLS